MNILIFTDLDGSLLDHDSYGWDAAKPALSLCKHLNIPVILVSSKTRAELNLLREEMKFTSPFVSENGGGIFFPREAVSKGPSGTFLADNLWKWPIGMPYEFLVKTLQEIRKKLGWQIQGFSEMTVDEISSVTGLDPERSRLAAMREFDEPFMVLEKDNVDITTLQNPAAKSGLMVTLGGRFFHLHGKNDKGAAVNRLISWYKESHQLKEVFTIALGDSPNDFSMLKQVDHPVLVNPLHHFNGLKKMIPKLRLTKEAGPVGWNSAVLEALGENSDFSIT